MVVIKEAKGFQATVSHAGAKLRAPTLPPPAVLAGFHIQVPSGPVA